MAKKKRESDTIRQQKLANKEFIKLKKMQRGEIPADTDTTGDSSKEMSLSDKAKNTWFYYGKYIIIGIIFLLGVVFGVSQCVKKPKYDLTIVYFTYEQVPDTVTERLAKEFKKYCDDTNKDGKINVTVVNCSCNPNSRANEIITKMQALITSDEQAVMFITDEESIKYFQEIRTDNETFFEEDTCELPVSFFEGTGYKPSKKLTVLVRNFKGTKFAKNGKDYVKTAKNVVKKLK